MSLSSPTSTASADDREPAPLASLFPWVISFLLHLGLVILATFVIWSTLAQQDEEAIIPIATLAPQPAARLQSHPTTQRLTTAHATRSLPAPTPAPAPSFTAPAPIIGLGAAPPAAVPSSDAPLLDAPPVRFLGVEGGNARQLAFVIDASGSVISYFPTILDHLKTTLLKLSDQQSFTVVFYQGDDVIEIGPPGLKRADTSTKRRVIDWLDDPAHVTPRGQTNPLKALRKVLQYKPQLIFILSDNFTGRGRYEVDQLTILNEIQHAVGKTRISTIQFITPDPLAAVPGRRGTLELIAEQTGGSYKYLDGEEFGF